jgi:two-component system response regulator AtoC
MQTKMLHVIEDKEIRPVGGEQLRKVDTRIVVATNRDLPAMVAAGTFREDLYFRISQFHIDLPPCANAGKTISLRLIGFFLQTANPSGDAANRARSGCRGVTARVPLAGQRARAGECHRAAP